MTPRVVLLDYGSGNIRSGERALARAGASVLVTGSVGEALEADGVVVPGVGAFAACADALRRAGAAEMLAQRLARERAVLAICVGHQVLFERGDEHGASAEGLAIWPGVVSEVKADVLPHVGWNTVAVPEGSRMFAGIADEFFYFVHSYAAHDLRGEGAVAGPPATVPVGPGRDAPLVGWTSYGEDRFVAAVEDGPLWSTQFHPEKSGDAGAALLRTWVASL